MNFGNYAPHFFNETFQLMVERRAADVAERLDSVFLYKCFHGPVIAAPDTFVRMMVTSDKAKLLMASLQSTLARESDGMGIVHIGALMEFEIEGHKVAGQFDSVMFMRQVGDKWLWKGGSTAPAFKRPRAWGKDPLLPV